MERSKMSKNAMLAFAVSLTLTGSAFAEGGGGPESNGVGWLLNPGPVVSARAPNRLASVADAQARVVGTQYTHTRPARSVRAVPWAFR